MGFHDRNGMRYFRFDGFDKSLAQAIFTRRGGVSRAPWGSLNVGGSVGDDPACVAQNRIRIFELMDRDPDSIHDVWLVHGTDVVHADAPRPLDGPAVRADAMLTNNPNVSLFMRFADCVPILFHDPKKRVVGIAHAGWQGTARGAAAATIAAMCERYGSKPSDIVAAIGPSIGVDHYEVGDDVEAQYAQAFGEDSNQLFDHRNGAKYLDLWAANAVQLQKAGVSQIEISGVCTACHLDDWFSHRAEKGKTGRFGALIALPA